MANSLTNAYRNNAVGDNTYTNVQPDADTIKAMFLDNADDTVTAADADISSIVSAGRIPAIASAPSLASKTVGTVGTGVFDAADTVFTALTGDQAEQLFIFKDTGTEATSIILAQWDTFTSGMPVTPNGGDVTVVWNASGIYSFQVRMPAIYSTQIDSLNYGGNVNVGAIELSIPSGTLIKLLGWWLSGSFSSPSEQGTTEWGLLLASSGMTSPSGTLTPVKFNPSDPASLCIVRYPQAISQSGTVIGYLEKHIKREIAGEVRIRYPHGREPNLVGPVFLSIVPVSVTAAGQSSIGMWWEESS